MTFSGFIKSDLVNYPGMIASTVFTCGCNFRCPYCHNPEFVVMGSDETYFGEVYSEEDILSYLKKRGAFLDALVISGGEPTLHQELPGFMRRVKELGLKIKLDSNGSRPDTLRSFIDEGLIDYIAMDIKAPLEKYHLLGFKDTGCILESIRILEESDVEHEFRTTCPRILLQEEDFPEMAKLIGDRTTWYLQTFNPAKTLDPAYNNVSSFSREELEDIIGKFNLVNAKVR
ncbi:MAG: anaerobic ribonucleoside-triphosphate reductase activating protein [Spirochaetales bacterium]|nr:anaerobic ribonucleoside-triphosphate reductase activating protein [Spirochaetales bacterium]